MCVLDVTADYPPPQPSFLGARLPVSLSSRHPDDATCLFVCTGDICESNRTFPQVGEKESISNAKTEAL